MKRAINVVEEQLKGLDKRVSRDESMNYIIGEQDKLKEQLEVAVRLLILNFMYYYKSKYYTEHPYSGNRDDEEDVKRFISGETEDFTFNVRFWTYNDVRTEVWKESVHEKSDFELSYTINRNVFAYFSQSFEDYLESVNLHYVKKGNKDEGINYKISLYKGVIEHIH